MDDSQGSQRVLRQGIENAQGRKDGSSVVAYSSEDYAILFIRAVFEGRVHVLTVCTEIEGHPAPRMRWCTDTFARLGEPPNFLAEFESAVFSAPGAITMPR